MKSRIIIVLTCFALLAASFAAYTAVNMTHMNNALEQDSTADNGTSIPLSINNHNYAKDVVTPRPGQPVKRFSLVAQESILYMANGLTMPVWTYNGSVPGTEIRVTKGDFVQVELENELGEPVTIHWHGYPLNTAMDGVPGINQDSVRPGETFLYEFSADVAGTYWYHSHQEGSKQVDKGLYGALIVEDLEENKPDKDYALILDEWMANPGNEMDMSGMNTDVMGMSMDPVLSEEIMMATNYSIYTVNGKTGQAITPLMVETGDTVRLRFINAGYRSHGIHIPGQDIKVISTDGQVINGASLVRDQILTIAPGERYDVELMITNGENFNIDLHDNNFYNNQVVIPILVTDGNGTTRQEVDATSLPLFDIVSYGIHENGEFNLNQKFDVDYDMELNTKTAYGKLEYTINGKVFSELPPLEVKTGDLVRLTLENKSIVDHPMHLHGHFFEVLSKNGIPVSRAVITKDTLLVLPGEKYVVAFKADNPGNWVQHCHELHHAAGGMMQSVVYTDFHSNYVPDPNNKYNNPE